MAGTNKPEVRDTAEYPTRYAAFREPGIMFQSTKVEARGGYEAAAYSRQVDNVAWPGITDGVYVEVIGLARERGSGVRGWLVDAQASRPDAERLQLNRTRIFPAHELLAAIEYARQLAAELESFVSSKSAGCWSCGSAREQGRTFCARCNARGEARRRQ